MEILCFLIYALGFTYLLFGIIDRLQKQERSVESLFWSATATLVNTTLIATILTIASVYHFWLLLAIHGLEAAVLVLIGWHKKLLYSPKTFWARLKSYDFHILPAIILVVALALYALLPSNFMLSGRDQGIYIIHGIHIAEEGKFSYDSDEFLNENFHEYQRVISLGYPAFYSDFSHSQNVPEYTEYLFGESFSNPDYGDLTPQFMPAYPALLAVSYDVGGLPMLFRVNAVLAAFALLALYYLARRYFGKTAAWICLLFLALCPAQIWTARITLTEILAQLFFLISAYLISSGWESGQKYRSLLGGALLGLSLFVRIDVYIYGLGLLFVAAYCAIWNRQKLSYLLPAVYSYCALGVLASLWALLNVRPYFVDLYRSGSLKLVLLANVALAVAVLFCAALGRILNRKKLQKDWMTSIFASRSGAICIAGFFIVAMLYLYFVRPLPITNPGDFATKAEANQQLEQVFRSRSLIEFSYYTSVTAILFAIYGLYRFLRNQREKVSVLLVFFALCISNLMVYLYEPSIYPDHIWASRRWVFVCMPFIFLLAAYGISQIKLPKIKAWGNYALRGISILVVSGFLIYQSSPFLFQKIMGGVADQYQALSSNLDDDEIYFSSTPEYVGFLRFVYGKNVYYLNSSSVVEFLKEGHSLNFIGGSPYVVLDPFQTNAELLSSNQISGTYLEQTFNSFPRKCFEISFPAKVWRITYNENLKEADLPLSLFQSMGRLDQSTDTFVSDGSGKTLLYGPYIKLNAGEYTAQISFRIPKGTQGKLARVDFCASKEKYQSETMLYSSDFSSSGEYTLHLPISLPEEVRDFELRVFPEPGVALEVTGVKLIKNSN